MNQLKILISCLFFFISTLFLPAEVKKGDVVFNSNFNNETSRKQWSTVNTAKWIKNENSSNTCLFINGNYIVKTNVNLSQYRGTQLKFKCHAKAENVTKPLTTNLGVKFMVHYKSTTGEVWKNKNDIYGTFDWKELSFTTDIPTDVTNVDLSLGLQGSTGKVWFDSISITVQNVPAVSNNNIKLKAVTKFRGVMSPIVFKQKDIQGLGKEWGANLIRWQISMSTAQSKTIGTNLAKYDTWLNGKLKELDTVLIACKQYGIKVVIDLHSIPGGRDNSGTKIFYDKQYNDHFIAIWQTIAHRYIGNQTVWGFDLMNEPIQNNPPSEDMDYIQTQIRASEAIRNIDKKTPIIFEVDDWDSATRFISLSPIPVSNVIYEVHMYQPGTFTHQGVINNNTNIIYPGFINGNYYDKNTLKGILQPVRDFQLRYHVPIYVGEFSAIRWAPGAAQYLNDCIGIFEEYGWNWTYHAFREWNGWDVEYENGTSKTAPPKRATQDTDRKKVLLKWFEKNKNNSSI